MFQIRHCCRCMKGLFACEPSLFSALAHLATRAVSTLFSTEPFLASDVQTAIRASNFDQQVRTAIRAAQQTGMHNGCGSTEHNYRVGTDSIILRTSQVSLMPRESSQGSLDYSRQYC
jgi:hypothetical protein